MVRTPWGSSHDGLSSLLHGQVLSACLPSLLPSNYLISSALLGLRILYTGTLEPNPSREGGVLEARPVGVFQGVGRGHRIRLGLGL